MAAREDYADRDVAVEYKNVKVNSAALDEMLVHSKGKRVVPVIVDGSNVIIGFGGT